MKPGRIYVDSRVGSKELAGLIGKHGIPVEVCTLSSADFAFTCGHGSPTPYCEGECGCKIGVERKTLGDLCGSLLTNRMGKQVPEMLRTYTMAWVVVEGVWRPGRDDAIEISRGGEWKSAPVSLTYSQLSSWLVRYDVIGGGKLKRWRTGSPTETAAFLASLYRWWHKDWDKHQLSVLKEVMAPDKILMKRPTQLHLTAMSFKNFGLGDKTVWKIGKHFGSILEMVQASEDEWVKAGLGKAYAKKVWEAIRRKYR